MALWMRGPLSYLEQLCLISFRDAGHPVTLFSYMPIPNVPAGITCADASGVLPLDTEIIHARTGSPALHSDLFRYRLLAQYPGAIWADTDAYCWKPFMPREGHFYGWESASRVNGGVLALPKDSLTLRALLEFTADPYPIPPWFSAEEQTRLAEARAKGDPVHVGALSWGVWGPQALTWFLHETGEIRHALPTTALYPVSFKERAMMLKRGQNYDAHITEDTYSVHFYGRRMRRRLVEKEGGVPKHFSLLGKLLRKHGVDPYHAPIGPPPALQQAS